MKETMTLSAFAKRHSVSRKTATRWRQAGYVVPASGPVDVVRSEALLRGRPATSRGGTAKGPTAADDGENADEVMTVAAHVAGYKQFRDAHQYAVEVYDAILDELRALPAGSAESEVHRIHYVHQDALGAAVQATR